MKVQAPFKKRLFVVYCLFRYWPMEMFTGWGWTVLTNYLFQGVIVELEDYR